MTIYLWRFSDNDLIPGQFKTEAGSADEESMKKGNCVFLLLLFFGLGCSKSVPVVSSSMGAGSIALDQSKVLMASSSVNVTGTCSRKITGMDLSTDGGHSWVSPANLGATMSLTCLDNGKFSLQIPSSSVTVSGNSMAVLFRGISDFGLSNLANLDILNGFNQPEGLLIGYDLSSSGGFALKGKVSGLSTSHSSSSGSFKLVGALRVQ